MGHLPDVLYERVPEDRLVRLEASVDDMEKDRFTGHEVQGVGQEAVVPGDEVDLARRGRATGHDRRGGGQGGGLAGDQDERGESCSGGAGGES